MSLACAVWAHATSTLAYRPWLPADGYFPTSPSPTLSTTRNGRLRRQWAAIRSAETRGGAPEGRGGAPNELPPEKRLSIMSIWRARQSSTIRARKALQNGGFAAFVDNVDTRARIKIHVALSVCYICRLDVFSRAAGPGHHRCHRQYRQSAFGPSAEGNQK